MKLKLLFAALLISTTTLFADIPKAGDTAPQFTGTDQNSKDFKLADLVGKKIVLLYFYPKDFTGGCTKEACSFRDGFEDFAANNVEIVGVSFDSADSHLKFIAKYKLNFTLLADPDGRIADIYGVRMAGKNMAKRVSFLIGLDGKIVHVTDTGNPDVHLAEMKAAIAATMFLKPYPDNRQLIKAAPQLDKLPVTAKPTDSLASDSQPPPNSVYTLLPSTSSTNQEVSPKY